MADLVIRGMEMPKSCEKCPVNTTEAFGGLGCRVTGYIPLRKAGQDFPDRCPLVPLPEGHGRLGDLETAEAILHNKAFDLAGTSAEYNALNWALRQIKALPTIVPAEGGPEDGKTT